MTEGFILDSSSSHLLLTEVNTEGIQPTDAADHPLSELTQQCPRYASLICGLSAELKKQNCPFDEIKQALHSLIEESHGKISFPAHEEVSLLFIHLRNQKMCHENDIDLLYELFKTMQKEELKEEVTTYANKVALKDVRQHLHQQTLPLELNFLMITFHDTPALTLGKAFKIKHYMSNLLNIQKHVFTLVGCQSGCVGLIWHVPKSFLSHTQSKFQESTVKSSLITSEHLFSSIELKLGKESVATLVFSKSSHKSDCDDGLSVGTHKPELVPFTTVVEQRSKQLCESYATETVHDQDQLLPAIQHLTMSGDSSEERAPTYMCIEGGVTTETRGRSSAVTGESLISYEHMESSVYAQEATHNMVLPIQESVTSNNIGKPNNNISITSVCATL